MNKLEQAARALLAHWDTPAWKYLKPTGDLMADLREALEKPYADKEAMFDHMKDMVRIDPVTGNVGIGTPSKQSVSQEPVAYKYKESSPETGEFIFAKQAEQEPVAWKDLTYGNLHHQDFGNSIPLYTAPVRTKNLTDDEISKIWDDSSYGDSGIDFARAVIAADREKNRG